MKEHKVVVKIYGESKTHGFGLVSEMPFESYCAMNGYKQIVWYDTEINKPEPYVTVLCQFGIGDVFACGFWTGTKWCVDRINITETPSRWQYIYSNKAERKND